ncbi:hypothetical protein GCM10009678_14590 [Actinomadura kijaniata]
MSPAGYRRCAGRDRPGAGGQRGARPSGGSRRLLRLPRMVRHGRWDQIGRLCKYRNSSGNTWHFVDAPGTNWDDGWIYSGNIGGINKPIPTCVL